VEKTQINERRQLTEFHRNLLIPLGKLPLRKTVIRVTKWLLTEGLLVRI
jgi:hypothetical protein